MMSSFFLTLPEKLGEAVGHYIIMMSSFFFTWVVAFSQDLRSGGVIVKLLEFH